MSLAAEKPRLQTVADLLAIPEQQRFHELIDGEIVQKATPTFEHGDAQGEVYAQLRPYKGRPGGRRRPGGWWFATEVEIEFGQHQVFRPDVVGWRRDRVPQRPSGTPVKIRPDWICEVLSPSNARTDRVVKLNRYHSFDVPHYWIVDPIDETLTVYRWTQAGYTVVLTALRNEEVRAEPFELISLRVGVFFGDEEDDEDPA